MNMQVEILTVVFIMFFFQTFFVIATICMFWSTMNRNFYNMQKQVDRRMDQVDRKIERLEDKISNVDTKLWSIKSYNYK